MSGFNNSNYYENNLDCNRGEPRKTKPVTDLTKWFLTSAAGAQTWEYVHEPKRQQTLLERYSVGLDTDDLAPALPVPTSAAEAARNAVLFYSKLQAEDGHWANDNSAFLMPIIVLSISTHITGIKWLKEEQRIEMIRYIRSVQCPNGGWPMNIVGPPTVYGCCMVYVVMRLLGVPANDPDLVVAKQRIQELGGVLSIPTWGKFWLAIMNLYSWEGMHTPLPEIWLLPEWLPFHPRTMWCFTRLTYMAMAYIHHHKLSVPLSNLILQIRQELYTVPYDSICWYDHKSNISWADIKFPYNPFLSTIIYVMDMYDRYHLTSLRKKALDMICEHLAYDDEHSNYVNISAICKSLQLIVCWHRYGPESKQFNLHQERVKEYLWMGRDGLKCHPTHGSQTWDISFIVQALLECNAHEMKECQPVLDKAFSWLKISQIPENTPDHQKFYRHPRKGGFAYNTVDNSWMSVDTTGEALKAILSLKKSCSFLTKDICKSRIKDTVDLLLSLCNEDGGFASFELVRGMACIESMNNCELFGNSMTDHSSVEMTSSVLTALAQFMKQDDEGYKSAEIKAVLQKNLSYIRNTQKPDGSWIGEWGICFIYGTFFTLEALACMGDTYESGDAVKNACDWLVTHRLIDGGWGEKFESYDFQKFYPDDQSQLVQTAWAILGLMAVRYPDRRVIEKGIEFIVSRQLPNGDFLPGNIMGTFLKTNAIHYDTYKNVFPMMALGRFAKLYPHQKFSKLNEKDTARNAQHK